MSERTVVFIPCCKSKNGSGGVISTKESISYRDLPNTWNYLNDGRKEMETCIDQNSDISSAINVYSGKLYSPIISNKNEIIDLIKSGQLRIFIISAGYGLLDAFEPIKKYEAVMSGKTASIWQEKQLIEVIADLLLMEKPAKIFGFFGGESSWYSSSKYRYFFTEGVKKALEKKLMTNLAGCFYRIHGGGFPSFKELGSLGKVFVTFMKTGFNDSFVEEIKNNNWIDADIIIGFEKLN